MRITFVKIIFLVTYCIAYLNVNAQNISAIELQDDKNAVFRKIAWVSDDKFCVLSDRATGSDFPHFITVYDTTGIVVGTTEKIKTKFSSQHDYVFSLKSTLFFLKKTSDSYGVNEFTIEFIKKDTQHIEERGTSVFKIRNTQELKLLNELKYNFVVYKGEHNQKAILAYNNDFKGEIKEGFAYRILNNSGELSTEMKLELPYADRSCNILDVIYDDEKDRVYMLCDVFELLDNGKRKFMHSFIGVFNLKNKEYVEVKDIPSFNQNKIQHLFKDSSICFAGIFSTEKLKQSRWMQSIVAINTNDFSIVNSYGDTIPSSLVAQFFDNRNRIDKDYLLPVVFFENGNNSYTIGWNYFFTLKQLVENEKNTSAMMGGFYGGLIGGALASGVESAFDNSTLNNLRTSLWLEISPHKKSISGEVKKTNLLSGQYRNHSVDAFSANGEVWQVYNFAVTENNKRCNICATKISNDFNQFCDNIVSDSFLKVNANTIFPGSGIKHFASQYFLGAFDPKNDIDKNWRTTKDFKLLLIKIE